MFTLTAKWTDLEQAIENARALGEEVGGAEVLDRALLTAGRPLRDELARGTPRSNVPPHLADQWIIRISRLLSELGMRVAKVGPKAGKGSLGYVAVFLEYGTWKMAPRPWIRSTYDGWKPSYPRLLTEAIRKHYKRVIKKYTRNIK